MRRKILIALIIVILAVTALSTVYAMAKAPPQSGNYPAYGWNPQIGYKNMPMGIIGNPITIFIVAPLIIEIIIAISTGMTKLKVIFLTNLSINVLMQILLRLWVSLINQKLTILFIVLFIIFSITKYLIYKKAFEYYYTKNKVKSHVVVVSIATFIYLILIFA